MSAALQLSDRTVVMLSTAGMVVALWALATVLRRVVDARDARRRGARHKALAVQSNRVLSCELCRQPHGTLYAVPILQEALGNEDEAWLCGGCHAVLVAGKVSA